ncbi:hypothetical protein DM860_014600 [Cuscuta australis]|uniref:Pentacotripeptide-repeat region of PRORP domain-containing protein n=1 Tax=Cuscuta australis TaxID=267555 RepID=A0A328DIZ1_9ASTE|nr:hypothetical protein DM860_014600 [Cuscuta australis]
MFLSKPLSRRFCESAAGDQILAAIIQNRPFDASLLLPSPNRPVWTTDTVSEVLRSIPRFLFRSPRSIGRQSGFRHRSPLRQRNLREESDKARTGKLLLGPAAYRDPEKVKLGLEKALEFFDWVETHSGFTHDELTCREMAIVLAKGSGLLKPLLFFLKRMSKRGLVTTPTITCLIKVLGEEGLANEALFTFYRMKQFHCRPDVHCYNTLIYALCRVGKFEKAKSLLQQMELPGFRCPPDKFTYTVLISSHCRHAMETGCRKAIRRRMWEANHLFRLMLFKGFAPDVVTYNSLINGCCKTFRIDRALELLRDMEKRGCDPNRVTYGSFIRYYSAVNEIEKGVEMMRRMVARGHGVATNSCYTPLIHGLCEAGRAVEAWDLVVESVKGGSIPREHTYSMVIKGLEAAGEMKHFLDGGEVCSRIEEGIFCRSKEAEKHKPFFARKNALF